MDEDDECGSWQWVPVVAVIKPEGRETWVPVFLWPRPESPGPPLTGKVRRGSGTPCDGHWSHLYWGRRILIVSVQGLLGMVNKFP